MSMKLIDLYSLFSVWGGARGRGPPFLGGGEGRERRREERDSEGRNLYIYIYIYIDPWLGS